MDIIYTTTVYLYDEKLDINSIEDLEKLKEGEYEEFNVTYNTEVCKIFSKIINGSTT